MLARVLARDAVDLRQRQAVKAQVALQVRLVEFGTRRLAGPAKATIKIRQAGSRDQLRSRCCEPALDDADIKPSQVELSLATREHGNPQRVTVEEQRVDEEIGRASCRERV